MEQTFRKLQEIEQDMGSNLVAFGQAHYRAVIAQREIETFQKTLDSLDIEHAQSKKYWDTPQTNSSKKGKRK